MRFVKSIALVFSGLLFIVAAPALAQSTTDEPQASKSALERIGELKKNLESGEAVVKAPSDEKDSKPNPGQPTKADTHLLPDLIDPNVLTEDGRKSMQAALKGYYDYRIKGFDHRARVFEWQLLSSRIIFVLVILIVLAGLYFSWLQFMAGQRGGADQENMNTTVEATIAGGIKVSSPILGVIILTLSLIFFYLYLVHVYPISEIF